ncbi:hypothetical protein ACN38_g3964 [Penicillium nordicum]|uniref:Uncharacterized protein n=1 Tax=Penicillium nordicum TaxID=229535 RepID=A0A0M9WHJ0_9EURO|nr:hypothetical protein ACN38_g3964 [Penicillium nordicum]
MSIDSIILQQQSQGVYLAPENLGKQLSHFECQLACSIDGSVLFENVKGQGILDARVFACVLGPAIEFLMCSATDSSRCIRSRPWAVLVSGRGSCR